MTGPSLAARAAARRELTLRAARRSFAAFVEHAFGYRLAPHHRRWASAVHDDLRLVILAPIEHGKSSLLSVALPLWTLGTQPDARIALVSETHTQAARPLAAIREHILRNPRVREVFPRLCPAGGAREKWSDSEIVVERPTAAKDPSVIALGVSGPLLGARLDLAILDDVCSFDNTFTAAQRAKVIAWFRSTLVGRVVAGGRIIAVGTPWHREDLLHELERSGEYRVLRDPALGPDGAPLWPEAWPIERLDQRRREIGETEFSRQMLLHVIDDAGSRFRGEWFDRAFVQAASVGAELAEKHAGPELTFTGVDLGVGQTSAHDESVLFTLALLRDGRRRVLAIEAGRWQAPELVNRIRSARDRFRSRIRVETNGAQAYVAQFLGAAGVNVEAHTTGRNRHDPVYGIESLAIELEQGRWIVPDAPETRAWARELLAFSPSGHPGDRVVASWLAREALRAHEERPRVDPLLLGISEAYEGDDDDEPVFWVLGPSRARPRLPQDAPRSIPTYSPRGDSLGGSRKARPYIVR